MRLDKYLADLGISSRKEIRQMIRSGRIHVNEACVKLAEYKVNPDTDIVKLDGELLQYRKFRYFAIDKPTGLVTASEDRRQQTVLDILPAELKHLGLFPVGRLDKDTTGLLLLTNDGDFAHKVISPKSEIEKKYYAVTEGIPDFKDVAAFQNGLVLRDGLKCLPATLEVSGENSCFVTVKEGKYHQVKRMLASVGKPVLELRRISIGNLFIENLDFSDGICELSQEDLSAVFSGNTQKNKLMQADI